MAINLIPAPTGGAPLSTNDYDAQNEYIQALILVNSGKQLLLTEWDTTTVPALAEYVYIMHGGALFQVQDSDYAISGSPSAGRVYIKIARSGDTLTASFVNSAVGYSWNYVYNGFYHADGSQLIPYVLWLDTTDYYKFDLSNSVNPFDITETIEFSKTFESGSWNMDTTAGINPAIPANSLFPEELYSGSIVNIWNNSKTTLYHLDIVNEPVPGTFVTSGYWYINYSSSQVACRRLSTGLFDQTGFNNTFAIITLFIKI